MSEFVKKEMYCLKKVLDIPKSLCFSSNMYSMKKMFTLPDDPAGPDELHASCNGVKDPKICNHKLETFDILEKRQKNILDKLNNIKAKLNSLAELPVLYPEDTGTPLENNGIIHDLAISSSPSQPPYSVLAIKKYLEKAGNNILLSNRLHSSANEVDKKISNLFSTRTFEDRNQHNIAFTVIWKPKQTKSLMISPISQQLIEGESNILRYISRLLPPTSPFNYEAKGSFVHILNTDNWLDTLQSKFLHGSNKDQQSVLKQLNSKLGTSKWICEDDCGLADIFAWSTILQLNLKSKLSNNVSSWFKNVSNLCDVDLEQNESHPKPMERPNVSDNSKHVDRDGIERFMNECRFGYIIKDHPPVMTVEKMLDWVHDMPGLRMKNLFLSDKKKNLFLLSTRHDAKIQLNDVAKQIGAKDLRFGNEKTMEEILGIKPGSVTLYSLINDKENKVKLILDEEALNKGHKYVLFHPMTNKATLGISPGNLEQFLKLIDHEAKFVLRF